MDAKAIGIGEIIRPAKKPGSIVPDVTMASYFPEAEISRTRWRNPTVMLARISSSRLTP